MSLDHEEWLRKFKKTLCLCVMLAVSGFAVTANADEIGNNDRSAVVQQKTRVTVTVVDENGEPVLGASVISSSTKRGGITDSDGRCTVEASKGETLNISYVGYTTQSVTVSGSSVSVTLVPSQTTLEDVVVVGYGTAKAKDVSGAISNVKFADKEITNLPNPNALVALSSKVAGLKYSPTNTADGDNTSTMTLRGKNSIVQSKSSSAESVNSPLIVVDGVIFHGSIQEVSTNDIQSIDVLKDASAAAIYGSRAANGVIIITTKKGTTEKPTVKLNTQWSFSGYSRKPDMVDNATDLLTNRYNYNKQANDQFANYPDTYAELSGDELETVNSMLMNTVEKQAYDQGIWTDWLDEISRTGFSQKYEANVSGMSKFVNYYISGDYTRSKGIRKGNDYEKYDIMAKLDITVNDWMKVGLKANFLSAKAWGVPAKMQHAMWYSPFSFIYCQTEGYTDWYSSKPDGNVASPYIGSGSNDSYAYTSHESHNYNLNGIFYVNLDCPWVEGLSYRMTLSGTRNSSFSDTFNDPRIWVDTQDTSQMDNPSQFLSNVSGSSSSSHYGAWIIDNIFTYTKDIQKHHVDAMLGYSRESTNNEGLSTSYSNFSTPVNLKWYIQSYSDQDSKGISRTRTRTSSVSYMARLNYNYASTYYGTFNFRRDGYSAFASGHKWGNFYGVSGAWVMSNENFIKDNVSWIDYLKLRLSWGQNGSRSVSAYATTASLSSWYTWLDNQSTLGFVPTNLPNRELTWATVSKWNLGIDFSLLANRLDGTIDLYTGKTTDMLVTRSVPYPSGYQSAYDNVGKVTNKGIEITLHSVNLNGDGKNTLRWESNLTFDSNTNKIKSLFGKNYKGEESDDVANAVAYGYDSYYALMVGHPINSAYDLKKLGVFQTQEEIDNYVDENGNQIQPDAQPGDLKFEDWNGDGQITTDDRHYIGTMDPLFTVNFGNTFSYKNFSLYFSFRWEQGDDEHFLGYDPYAFSYHGGIQLKDYHGWTQAGDGDKYPRYNYSNSFNYQYWNERTYLKLKDLVFSYDFDKDLIGKIGLTGLRLYISGTDLFTITGWSGLDPEDGGTLAQGSASDGYVSNGTYRTFNIGANITF